MKKTVKTVQVHFNCICGHNEVYNDTFFIKWTELSMYGISRKKDKDGKPHLAINYRSKECFCDHKTL